MDSCQRSPSTRPKTMNGRHYHSLFNTLPFTLDIFNSLPCMTTIFPSTSLFSILVKSPLRVSARKLRALSLRRHMLRDRKLALLFTDIPTQHSHDGPAFCALDPLREVAGLLEQKYFRTNIVAGEPQLFLMKMRAYENFRIFQFEGISTWPILKFIRGGYVETYTETTLRLRRSQD